MSSRPRSRPAPGLVPAAVFLGSALVVVAVLSITLQTDPFTAVGRAWESLFPPPAITDQGQEIRSLYEIVFIIAAIIFFIVEGLIVWTVIRYRRQPGDDELPPQTHGNNLAETIWTVVPTLIVAFVFFISWQTLNSIERVSSPRADLEIRVTGAQFSWTFDYLDQNGESQFQQTVAAGETPDIGGLVLPAERSIKFYLTSNDVIHSFYIPAFLYKRDVNPEPPEEGEVARGATPDGSPGASPGGSPGASPEGSPGASPGGSPGASPEGSPGASPEGSPGASPRGNIVASPPPPETQPSPGASPAARQENIFEVKVDEQWVGRRFSGQCAELCGIGHRAMVFDVHVLSGDDFEAWLAEASRPEPSPSGAPPAVTAQLAAQNIEFDPVSLGVRAGQPFGIEFTNADSGVPHDVDIRDAAGNTLQDQEPITDGTTTYIYEPLEAGTYTYICSIHPQTMIGDLQVQ
jgi:heme/copper-type cytochrome/quinol oxidase subunit 2